MPEKKPRKEAHGEHGKLFQLFSVRIVLWPKVRKPDLQIRRLDEGRFSTAHDRNLIDFGINIAISAV